MTGEVNDGLDALAMLYPCAHCQAERGHWCSTTSGAKTQFLHALRTQPVREAYAMGYCFGRE